MKWLILTAVLTIVHGAVVNVDQCVQGPSYWCSHISHAKECHAVRHCIDTVWSKSINPKSDNAECEMCELVLREVDNMLKNKQDQDEILSYMKKACDVIPNDQLSQECKTTVTNYFPEIASMLLEALDPVAICGALNLCPTLQNMKSLAVPYKKPAPPGPANETVCADCKKFLGDVQKMVDSKKTRQEIADYIEQGLCQKLAALESLCNQVVEAYLQQILDLLANEVDPATVCQAIGFCPAMTKTSLMKALLAKSPLYTALQTSGSGEECVLCHTAVEYLQNLDRQKATQDEIKSFIEDNVCSKLGSEADLCKTTIEEYAPILFELIANEMDPNTVCKALGFCSSSRANIPLLVSGQVRLASVNSNPAVNKMTQSQNVKASVQCVLCEFILNQVDSMLTKNTSEAEIIAALDKVCSLLPKTISDECTTFVNEYGPAVVALLAQELDPTLVCTTLGLCSSKLSKPHALKLGSPSEYCGTCEMVIQYLDSLLEENATVQDIEMLLDKICNFLPDQIKGECTTLVDQYGPTIAQLLQQLIDPKVICKEIGLCNSTVHTTIVKQQQHLLGTNECTYGPAYWCNNMDNAKKCNAIEHCKRHVWKN